MIDTHVHAALHIYEPIEIRLTVRFGISTGILMSTTRHLCATSLTSAKFSSPGLSLFQPKSLSCLYGGEFGLLFHQGTRPLLHLG